MCFFELSVLLYNIKRLTVGYTYLTLKGLNTWVYVLVLFQSRWCSKSLSTISTSMTSCTVVLGSDVTLKIRWVCEVALTVLAWKSTSWLMDDLMAGEVGLEGKATWALFTLELSHIKVVRGLTLRCRRWM